MEKKAVITFPSVQATQVEVKKVVSLSQQMSQREKQKMMILHRPLLLHPLRAGGLFLLGSVPIVLVVKKSWLFGLRQTQLPAIHIQLICMNYS